MRSASHCIGTSVGSHFRRLLLASLIVPFASAFGQDAPVSLYVPKATGTATARALRGDLEEYLGARVGNLKIQWYDSSQQLVEELASGSASEELMFIYCVLDSCDRLVRRTGGDSPADRFHLRVVNASLFTLPLYLFTRTDTDIQDLGTIRLGYYHSKDHRIRRADLIEAVNYAYEGSWEFEAELQRDATYMAQAFWKDDPAYDVIAVYDEEPSLFLDEMLKEIDNRRRNSREEADKLKRAALWPIYLERDSLLYRPSTERDHLDYVITKLSDRAFLTDSAFYVRPGTDSEAAILAMRRRASRSAEDSSGFEELLPIILTNAAHLGWSDEDMSDVERALSNSYFTALEQIRQAHRSGRRDASLWSELPAREGQVARTYLLNSHFTDPENRFKMLALREYDTSTNKDRAELVSDKLCSLGLPNKPEFEQLAGWLGLPETTVSPRVREAFNGSPVGPFRRAQRILAGELTPAELRAARDTIIAALKLETEPGSNRGQTGMWNFDYSPFYLLALIDVLLPEEEHRSLANFEPCES